VSTLRLSRSLLGLAVALLATGCASETFTRSGFLPDYSRLTVEDAPAGGKRMVYVSPDFTPARYHALILEPVVFFPEPKPTELVSAETLAQIRGYMDTALRAQLSPKVALVDQPGPGVARWRLAFTAVGSETDEMEPYQFIPIALVITGAMALAEGGLPQEPRVGLEVQITDSQSSAPLLLLVRGGTGEKLKTEKVEGRRPVDLDSLKELFDEWAKATAEQANHYIAPKR